MINACFSFSYFRRAFNFSWFLVWNLGAEIKKIEKVHNS